MLFIMSKWQKSFGFIDFICTEEKTGKGLGSNIMKLEDDKLEFDRSAFCFGQCKNETIFWNRGKHLQVFLSFYNSTTTTFWWRPWTFPWKGTRTGWSAKANAIKPLNSQIQAPDQSWHQNVRRKSNKKYWFKVFLSRCMGSDIESNWSRYKLKVWLWKKLHT